MLKRLVFVIVVLPIALLLVALAVANRQDVSLNYNPIQPDMPGMQLTAPMFVFMFIVFALGMIVGSMATWLKQSRYRRAARTKEAEAEEWRFKADKERERAQAMAQTLVSQKQDSGEGPRYPMRPREGQPLALLSGPR